MALAPVAFAVAPFLFATAFSKVLTDMQTTFIKGRSFVIHFQTYDSSFLTLKMIKSALSTKKYKCSN